MKIDDHTSTPEREEDQPQQHHQQQFASSYHAPVMYKECIDALLKKSHLHVKKHKNKYRRNKRHQKDEKDSGDTAPVKENGDDNGSGSDSIRRPRVYIDGMCTSMCIHKNFVRNSFGKAT